MQVTNAGYKDPNNLKFEDITVLGVPNRPSSVTVTHNGTGAVTILPSTSITHDAAKKVQ